MRKNPAVSKTAGIVLIVNHQIDEAKLFAYKFVVALLSPKEIRVITGCLFVVL